MGACQTRGGLAMAFAGVKFIEQSHVDALMNTGKCEFSVAKKQRESDTHPDIGDTVAMLLDNSSRTSRRIIARLIEDRGKRGGGCISVYERVSDIITPEPDPEEDKYWE